MSKKDVTPNAEAAFSDLDWSTAVIRAAFLDAGFDSVEPPILQSAEVFLNRSGEDIRRRMYVFNDPGGEEVCLRPDMTIPTCRMYLDADPKANGSAKLSYDGVAFRYQSEASDRPKEFWQAGIESLGARGREKADADVLGLIVGACEQTGLEDYAITIGDVGIFFALIDALDIPEAWRVRLRQSLWHVDEFEAVLKRYATNGDAITGNKVLSVLSELDESDARDALADIMKMAQISPVGSRSMEEITERVLAQAAEARADALPKNIVKLVNDYRKVTGKPPAAMNKIRALTKKAGVDIEKALATFEKRLALIEKAGIAPNRLTFDADFGRNMEYYTGFVFELNVAVLGDNAQVAGGGRYDTLLKSLGAPKDVPAVGGMIRTERLLAALGGAS